MIRAFAIGIGIGTTRIWLALFGIAGLDFASSFGPAFWISFSLHAVAAELWLRAFPNPPELAPRAAGRHLEPSPRSCRRSCRVGQTSLKDTCSYPGEGASKYYC